MSREKAVYPGILLAFLLWFATFVLKPFSFWLMMSFNTSLLAGIACLFGRPLPGKEEFKWRHLAVGLGSAALLYAVFWAGNQFLIFLAELVPGLIPDRAGNIEAVYAERGALPPLLIGALLFFPIGFGEELFWRGFVQRHFSRKWNGRRALVITTIIYTLVHLPTGNPILILASLTCGLYWGGLYLVTGSIVPVLLSHMFWDPAVFVLWPIR